MILPVSLPGHSYDIVIEKGSLKKAGELLNIKGKALVVTDSGVPKSYAETLLAQLENAVLFTFPQGEENKNVNTLLSICEKLLSENFTRSDCVIALGGGVTGDMAGFASAIYMRGIDFYNIPTTLLSQVDSSVGGKTAVDFEKAKNLLGAFHQPKKVIIDPELLSTLSERQISNGFAEAVKISVTNDKELFEIFENGQAKEKLEEVIYRAVKAKRDVVEQDEKETSLRRVLNFGHTLGHAIESSAGLDTLLHGECVALGMIPMCSDNIRERVKNALHSVGLKTQYDYDKEKVKEFLKHDKKASGKNVCIVRSDEIGTFRFENVSLSELEKML
ncbi:MAG: 3-dehydroquinate synthase [Clostridia bacterium]|nr:3-dehydroquinate synthase [Clostridia bacterium]